MIEEEKKIGASNSDFLAEERRRWVTGLVPLPFQGLTLDDFEPRNDQQRAAHAATVSYRDQVLDGFRHSLVLFGKTGSGKTFLASCLFNSAGPAVGDRSDLAMARLCGTADNVAWVNGGDLRRIVTGEISSPNLRGSSAQMMEHLCTCHLLVVDDFDKAPPGQWVESWLRLIDSRLVQNVLPTVITMNLSPAGLVRKFGQEYGGPLVDRLIRTGSVFVRMD